MAQVGYGIGSVSDLFVLAGEASGDRYGAQLLKELKTHHAHLIAFGVPGPRMHAEGVEPLLCAEDFAIMGFTDVIKRLPRLRQQLHFLTQTILKRRPNVVLLIDYGGFNLRLARRLRRYGYRGKIVQYISPKVWAWGRHRIKTMSDTLDLLITIFPFESACFAHTNLRVEYVGNPLIEALASYPYEPLTPSQSPVIGLFPGSRPAEIRLNARRQLDTAALVAHKIPHAQFALSLASEKFTNDLAPLIAQSGLDIELVPANRSYDLMARCTSALATSGTVNLELVLHRVPHVVVYRCTHLNALAARCLFGIRLPHYSIANFVHGTTFLPELIYTQFTPKRAAATLTQLLDDPDPCLAGCDRVRSLLRTTYSSARAAELISDLLRGR